MGLKPLNLLYFDNPFTEVNGNCKSDNLLPSALADGLNVLILLALATLGNKPFVNQFNKIKQYENLFFFLCFVVDAVLFWGLHPEVKNK